MSTGRRDKPAETPAEFEARAKTLIRLCARKQLNHGLTNAIDRAKVDHVTDRIVWALRSVLIELAEEGVMPTKALLQRAVAMFTFESWLSDPEMGAWLKAWRDSMHQKAHVAEAEIAENLTAQGVKVSGAAVHKAILQASKRSRKTASRRSSRGYKTQDS